MWDFFRVQFLTAALAVYSLFYTGYPYYLLCAAGLLMLVFTIENITEENSILTILTKAVLILFICLLSNGFLVFILFGQIFYKRAGFLLPSVVYLIFQAVYYKNTFMDYLPLVLAKMAVLFLASVFIWYLQKFAEKYTDYRNKMANSMKMLAVSGLAEKKLNQALVIQNNIIERNARFEERENISRNIHNNAGHMAAAASMALEAADILWQTDPVKAADKARMANERIKAVLGYIRHAVRVLDEEVRDIPINDFKMELDAVINNFVMDTEIKIYFDMDVSEPELQIPHEHTEFMSGAVAELLTNGVKHGNADTFTIWMQADSTHLQISVLDNGQSSFNGSNAIKNIQNGFGIKKIINYVKKAGGSTLFKNENGFYAEIMIPVVYPEDRKGE
ncbi:MAG: hypothetical protein K2K35_05645 [Lachnospiraceae bacterium]|nr:hypothetical protein [Lachnospiraceae bacterium]